MKDYKFSVPEFLSQTELEYEVENIKDFIAKAEDNFGDIKFGSGLDKFNFKKYFRGQSNSDYGLKTSIVRCMEHELKDKNNKNIINKAITKKEELIISLSEKNKLARNMSRVEKLAAMQHHGIPTRLLDITDDALVSLYFACSGNPEKDGRIFIFLANPKSESGREIRIGETTSAQSKGTQIQNEASDDIEVLRSDSPKIIRPSTIDPRIIAQSGLFITGNVTGSNYLYNPMGGKYKSPNSGGSPRTNLRTDEALQVTPFEIFFVTQKTLRKERDIYCKTIRIPKNTKQSILKELKDRGIDENSLFPNFEKFISNNKRIWE